MNSKLQDAVNIFKELGWEKATPENALLLPLGTKEQKQAALAGLKSGDWSGLVQTDTYKYASISLVDVDTDMLAIFAVRVGVDARRAAYIMGWQDKEKIIDVLVSRGAKYASKFIGFACVPNLRG